MQIETTNKNSKAIASLAILGLLTLLATMQMIQSTTTRNPANGQHESSSENNFCNGMSMVMAMGGFQWSLFQRPSDCLNYFAPGWQLNDAGKFQGAMLYSFLLGVMTEGVHTLEAFLRPIIPLKVHHLIMALLYGFQRFFGYIVMFIAMTYSWELLLSALLGLMVGHALFPNSTRREWRKEAQRSSMAARTSRHPTLATTLEESPRAESQDPLASDHSLPLRRRKQ